MTIERVSFRTPSFQNNLRVVVLKQKGGTRCLPTWVSPAEANDILLCLRGTPGPGPWPHDLIAKMMRELGGEVERIVISDYIDYMLFARIAIRSQKGEVQLEARPSDAIALAVRVGAPIYAEEWVLERAGLDDLTEPFVELVKHPDYQLANLWVSK